MLFVCINQCILLVVSILTYLLSERSALFLLEKLWLHRLYLLVNANCRITHWIIYSYSLIHSNKLINLLPYCNYHKFKSTLKCMVEPIFAFKSS